MAMLTITMKLHKPGRRKKHVIDRAMLNYSQAYQYLLDKAHTQIGQIRRTHIDGKGNYKAASIAKWVDKNISRELNQFGVQPFKDSLKLDFGMTLASYLSTSESKQAVQYPAAYLSEHQWQQRYDEEMAKLLKGEKSLRQCERRIDKIIRKTLRYRPVFFCRYASNRDYCLLHDPENNRYYAKLYLMNGKDPNRKKVCGNGKRKLYYIYKEGKALENTQKKERFILVPLSFGSWQESYLKKALDKPDMLKTARLNKKKKDYYLSVSINTGQEKEIKTENYMGVARGLKNPVFYAVVDSGNNVLKDGSPAMGTAGQKAEEHFTREPMLHRMANMIVDIAVRQKAQVVVQDLSKKTDKLNWRKERGSCRPILSPYTYTRLVSMLEYKLNGKRLPSPIKVSPVGIFHTCPNCGLHTGQNRFSADMFICVACGLATDIERLGSFNIARRLNQHRSGTIKIKMERTIKGIKLKNQILGLDYSPANPNHCMDEFRDEIKRIISEFYDNIHKHAEHKNFKKKYSLIKKIENTEDFNGLIQII